MTRTTTSAEVSGATIQTYLKQRASFPFCKGCGHNNVVRRLNEAMVALQLEPRNVLLVTDIGCIGLADGLFSDLHTVHTTHGRSTAFATGITLVDSLMGDGKLKTVVLIGDGGAMIGLQHLVHAAMLNIDLTVLICNNFVYGMTGGQGSGLTPESFITATTPQGNIVPPVDMCQILKHSHAPWVARALATDRAFPELLKKAIAFPGFAVLEVLELCTEFAVPDNSLTGSKLTEIAEQNNWQLGLLESDKSRRPYAARYRDMAVGKNDRQESPAASVIRGASMLRRAVSIVLAGSAGERVQSAAALACQTAIGAGLYVTQKNDNPVTQGSGYSLSELWFSPDPIGFTGIEQPDILLVTSEEGLKEATNQGWFTRLGPKSTVYLDETVLLESSDARIRRAAFRKSFGPKGAALGALSVIVGKKKIVDNEQIARRVGERYGRESENLLRRGWEVLSEKESGI